MTPTAADWHDGQTTVLGMAINKRGQLLAQMVATVAA
jgi:hypothetical protein